MNIVTEIASMRSVLEDLQKRIGIRQAEGITGDDPVLARMIGRKVELERALGVIEPMQAEVERLQRELTHLQIEVTNLRGLKPEIPPMPGEDWPKELPRYILRENGPRRPRSVPHKDGYWTPWYLANQLYEELERERKAAKTACENWGKVKEERDQLKAALHVITEAGNKLSFGLVEDDVTSEESEFTRHWFGKLQDAIAATPKHCLADHDAEVIEQMLSNMLYQKGMTASHYKSTELVNWMRGYIDQLRQQAKEVQS